MKELIERFKKVVEGQSGVVTHIEEWGLRDLAYRIDKQSKGYYALMRYNADGRGVEELERNLKLTDGILRYLTVRTEETVAEAAPVKAHGEGSPADGGTPGAEPSA
jgi:small subunit ribosomal protein S6